MFLTILAGICTGICTGLIPGLHINFITVLVLSYSTQTRFIYFLVAMSIIHTFLDFIPSILFGLPDEDTCLVILPAHRYVFAGKAIDAFYFTVVGSFAAIVIGIFIMPLFFIIIPFITGIKLLSPLAIIFILLFLFRKEKNKKAAIFIVFLASILGIRSLEFEGGIFPLLTGLFGVSSIIVSLLGTDAAPEQNNQITSSIHPSQLLRGCFSGTIAGAMVGMLPGLSSSQACLVANECIKQDNKTAMISLGAVNSANFLFNLATLYLIDKARSGVVLGIQSIGFSKNIFFMCICVALISAGCGTLIALPLFRKSLIVFRYFNYTTISLLIILFSLILVVYQTGIVGLIILVTSSALGCIPPLVGVRKNLCMTCLMIPILRFLLHF